jgi:hypothetical protein
VRGIFEDREEGGSGIDVAQAGGDTGTDWHVVHKWRNAHLLISLTGCNARLRRLFVGFSVVAADEPLQGVPGCVDVIRIEEGHGHVPSDRVAFSIRLIRLIALGPAAFRHDAEPVAVLRMLVDVAKIDGPIGHWCAPNVGSIDGVAA